MTTKKKNALGRGLSAILESPETDITSKDISGNYVVGAIAEIELSKIEVNPFQPRKEFDESALKELSQSIEEQGIIQPVTVRKLGYDRYQLISGERRFRASQLAGLKKIPAYIRLANDEQMLEMALIENIHRQELNAWEIAISYQRLLDEVNLTQEDLSKKIGKDRTTISNYLRILKVSPKVQLAIKDENISMGHARALLGLKDFAAQDTMLSRILKEKLSVRQTEIMIKESKTEKKAKKLRKQLPEQYRTLKDRLTNQLNTKVDISISRPGKGKISIPFGSEKQLEEILKKFNL
jgi:ParB family chromosome partitioning protein